MSVLKRVFSILEIMWPTSTFPNMYTALEDAPKPSFRSITNLLIYINAIFVWNFSFWDITLYYYGIFILLALSSHFEDWRGTLLDCRIMSVWSSGNVLVKYVFEREFLYDETSGGYPHREAITSWKQTSESDEDGASTDKVFSNCMVLWYCLVSAIVFFNLSWNNFSYI